MSPIFSIMSKMHAHEIWTNDAKRLETIASIGYRILVIRESEYKNGSWVDKLDRWLEENGKEKDIDTVRPSVNDHSSADVKLGELLETRGIDTTA